MDNIDSINWATVLVIFILFLVMNQSHNKYQVASFSSTGSVVIDQQTGEAWVTDSYDGYKHFTGTSEKIIYFKPIGYCDGQNDTYTYKPEEKRNNKNTTWWIWFKRKIGLESYYNN